MKVPPSASSAGTRARHVLLAGLLVIGLLGVLTNVGLLALAAGIGVGALFTRRSAPRPDQSPLEGAAAPTQDETELHELVVTGQASPAEETAGDEIRRAADRAVRLQGLVEAMTRLAGRLDTQNLLRTVAENAPSATNAASAFATTIVDGRFDRVAAEGLELADATSVIRSLQEYGLDVMPRSGELDVRVGSTWCHAVFERLRRDDAECLIVCLRPSEDAFDETDRALLHAYAVFAAESLRSSAAFEREEALTKALRERDAVKNTFLTAVSHELRTPLTNVLGMAQTLAMSMEHIDEAMRDQLFSRLVANAKKLDGLLSDLLDLDRLTRGIVTPFRRDANLAEVIRRTVEQMLDEVAVTVQLDLDEFVMAVEAAHVERIVENLLANADRYAPAGTQVDVRLRRVPGGCAITVADLGDGVRPDLRETIFEPFARGDKVREHAPGVGIGLTLVRQLSDMHGGRVWVTDREDGRSGAAFHVFLANAPADAGAERTADQDDHVSAA